MCFGPERAVASSRTELSRSSLTAQPCRALTMQHENPTARYELSFKAQNLLPSCRAAYHVSIPASRPRAAEPGEADGIHHTPRDIESVCWCHVLVPRAGTTTAIPHCCIKRRTHSSFFAKALGKKGLQSHSRGFMAEMEETYSRVTSKTPALPKALSSPWGEQGPARSHAPLCHPTRCGFTGIA